MEVCDEFPDNETREVAPMEQSIPLNATTYSGGVECSPITIEKRRKNTPESFRTKRPSPTASTVINRKVRRMARLSENFSYTGLAIRDRRGRP